METRNVEQKTVFRILMLMKLLKRNSLTIPEMIEYLSKEEDGHKVTRNTIYHYRQMIIALGLKLKQEGKSFKIDSDISMFSINDFSDEELALMNKLLIDADANNLYRNSLLKKLATYNRDTLPLVENLVRKEDIQFSDKIVGAIKAHKQISVMYLSANSHKIKPRLLEPKFFENGYKSVYCFDCDDNRSKTYDISRMLKVEILESPQINISETQMTDVFNCSNVVERLVELELSHIAKLELEKLYPLTRPKISDIGGGKFKFKTTYTHINVVAQFILSLPDEIKVLQNSDLKNYLNDKLRILKNYEF